MTLGQRRARRKQPRAGPAQVPARPRLDCPKMNMQMIRMFNRYSSPFASSYRALFAALAVCSWCAAGCDSDDSDTPDDSGDDTGPLVAVSSLVSTSDSESTLYVGMVDAFEGQTVDFKNAREFSGQSDLWVHDGAVFIADAERLTITRYEVRGRELVQKGRLGLSDYDPADFGFWVNTFVSNEKAYFLNAPDEYIVWNPKTMRITGTIPLPDLEAKDGLEPQPSYSDRAAVVRDGKLYQPIYWSDETFFAFAPNSRILVTDLETDEVVDTLEAPCPGIDFASADSEGNLYFSTWIFAPGGAAVLDQPATCVAKIPAAKESVEVAFRVSDVTGGRQGGAMRLLDDDHAVMSVLHADRAKDDDAEEVEDVAYGPYWHFWSYDLKSGKASELDAIDWNAGAAYGASAFDKSYLLVPSGDYMTTDLYELGTTIDDKPVLTTKGWSLRLFQVR